ncbi:hypothetical protein Bca52824_023803 [Brassica carinata]|uniref:Uncharacterized protein n=1 Tax=Brassica carinata TaxID=52824 RepID=A0A8X7VJA7_BRACI|nr:hypothetical protein Bca52824_023803 [Brassica carinata]
MMINNRKSWPKHFLRDEKANVYNLNPWKQILAVRPMEVSLVAGGSWPVIN